MRWAYPPEFRSVILTQQQGHLQHVVCYVAQREQEEEMLTAVAEKDVGGRLLPFPMEIEGEALKHPWQMQLSVLVPQETRFPALLALSREQKFQPA